MESTERWKSDGDCTKCRRDSYCKSRCKANQKAGQAAALHIVMEMMNGKAYKQKLMQIEESRVTLKNLLREADSETPDEKINELFERCKEISLHTEYSVMAVVATVADAVKYGSETVEDAIAKLERANGR